MKNKFYFLLYCDRSSSNIYNSHKFLIDELNKKLKNFYLLNYYYLNNSRENFKPEKKNKKFKIFEPKDFNELKNFSSNKNVVCILINNFGNNLPNISTNFIFKKLKFKVSLLKDIPTINQEDKLIFTKIFQSLKYKIIRLLINKFESFLRAINLLPKYEIFFLSNYEKFKKIKESLLFKFGLSSFKKIELINSRNYDNFKKKNPKLSQKFIVLLDDFFDHPSSLKLRGKISYKIVKKHYKLLNIFLIKMQKILKKKIVVCIHPRDNLFKKKKLFKNFKVFQFETLHYIYNSYVILFFDTTSILDGFYLKKRMLAIYSQYNDENVKYHIKGFKKYLNIQNLNIENLNFDKKNVLAKSSKPIRSFISFTKKHIKCKGNFLGSTVIYKKIINI